MKLLAFDTSSTACSVALQNADQVKFLHKNAPMQQAQLILPMIHELLAAFSLTVEQLDAIAYGCGPGSFTGIRIASSVAQGLGFAAQKPIIQISSLAALAQTAYLEHGCTNVLTAVDARMDQIYWAAYEVTQKDHIELIPQEMLCSPKDATAPYASDWCGVGDGWDKYPDSLGVKCKAIYPSLVPSAQALLVLARAKFDKSQWITANEAVPVYLR